MNMKEWNDISTWLFCLILLLGWPIIFSTIELIRWIWGNGLFSMQSEAIQNSPMIIFVQWIGSVVILTLLFSILKFFYKKHQQNNINKNHNTNIINNEKNN